MRRESRTLAHGFTHHTRFLPGKLHRFVSSIGYFFSEDFGSVQEQFESEFAFLGGLLLRLFDILPRVTLLNS